MKANNGIIFIMFILGFLFINLACLPHDPFFIGDYDSSSIDDHDSTSTNEEKPDTITFITEGESFSPIIVLSAPAEILWTFADNTTSTEERPVKNYGSLDTRINKLSVKPWSSVRRINIGYAGKDGGSDLIEHNTNQMVSSVSNLEILSPYLVEWCSCENNISSLDFSNFIRLETIECFKSFSLESINLSNTPALKRLCLESCNLSNLDLSQSPALEDLRGANNNYPFIEFGDTGSKVFHICIRSNKQLTIRHMFSDTKKFPELTELLIWDTNQAGSLVISSTGPSGNVQIFASRNEYETLNLAGALQNNSASYVGEIDLSDNKLSTVIISGCVQINELNLNNNLLDEAAVDQILADLDSLGRNATNTPYWTDLQVDLRGNAKISAAGIKSAENLAVKGWTVYTEGRDFFPASATSDSES